MLEELMLKREHFPLELLDFSGKPFANEIIIPPFHSDIVQNGINLDIAYSVLDKAVENTLLDLDESTLRSDVPRPEFNSEGHVIYGPMKRDEFIIYFPEFPFTKGLCIQRDKISPYGGDSGIRIVSDSPTVSYLVPKEVSLPERLLNEYNMIQRDANKYFHVTAKTGWRGHNIDFRDVFYKNFVIALNNAVLKEKYSK